MDVSTDITFLSTDIFRNIADFLTDNDVASLEIARYLKERITEIKVDDIYWKTRASKSLSFDFILEDTLVEGFTWEQFYKYLPDKSVKNKIKLANSIWETIIKFFGPAVFLRWTLAHSDFRDANNYRVVQGILKFDRDDLYDVLIDLYQLQGTEIYRFAQEFLRNALVFDGAWKIITKLIPEMLKLVDEKSEYTGLNFITDSIKSNQLSHLILTTRIYSKYLDLPEICNQILYFGHIHHLAWFCKTYPGVLEQNYKTIISLDDSANSEILSFAVSTFTYLEYLELVDYFSNRQMFLSSNLCGVAIADPRMTTNIKIHRILPKVFDSSNTRQFSLYFFKRLQNLLQLDMSEYIVPSYLKYLDDEVLYYINFSKCISTDVLAEFHLDTSTLRLEINTCGKYFSLDEFRILFRETIRRHIGVLAKNKYFEYIQKHFRFSK